ncbi:MAG: aromatic aminobenezylarsenical efflux permease ArsG family transporter [Pirellulaceae bacterium]
MQDFIIAVATAFWLGLLTSISPCPLATNIVAISYIGHRTGSVRQVFWSGMLYTLGRTIAYVALAVVIVAAALSLPQLSTFLQSHMHQVLGPLLIIVGMILLGLLHFDFGGTGISEHFRQRVDRLGLWGALLLGLVFALSFCPTSAALFFGSLLPLALSAESRVVLPSVYGVGTALPVFVFALVIAFSAQSLGAAFHVLGAIEKWARRATGVAFIAVGIWFSLTHVFHLW